MTKLNLSDHAPNFKLLGVDNKIYTLESFADKNVLIIIFSCNHCPYVQAYENRIISLQQNYKDYGLQIVAINSNDDNNYPEDSFAEMIKRAKIKKYNFPYLRDYSQETAKLFGATHTPHIFVFDKNRKLAYTGKIDDNWEDEKKQVNIISKTL